MLDLIRQIKGILNFENNVLCNESGVKISLGRELSHKSVIIKADNCQSISEMQRKYPEYKKCDCIILSFFEESIYLSIIELKTNTKIEENFEKRFLNCYERAFTFLEENELLENAEFDFYFFCIFKKNCSLFQSYVESINNKIYINGQRKTIRVLPNRTNLSEYFSSNIWIL